MQTTSLSLNTMPRYLPLIEACNESRLSKLPNLLEILRKSQLALAHESTEKVHMASVKKITTKNALDLVTYVKETKRKPKDFDQKLGSYQAFLNHSDASTEGIVVVNSKEEAGYVANRVRDYLAKFNDFIKKMETELSAQNLTKLYVEDKVAFNKAKESFIKENGALVNEGEQWLKFLQDLISNYKGEQTKPQDNRRELQDKVLQTLNILPLQAQLTEALFTEISTFKTHQIGLGVFFTRMEKFSNEIRAIYNSNEPADFISLKAKKIEYLKSYQDLISEANQNREKLAVIQKAAPEIPTHKAIGIHLDSIIINDAVIESESRKQSEEIISKIVKIYADAKLALEAAQAKIDLHIDSLLNHRINRLCNGIDWNDFSRTTWKRSVINWIDYSKQTN